MYSFAITLWEILTFAREQPFENLSDEKVVENFGHIYKDDKKHVSTHEIFHSVICCFIRFDKSVLELYVYTAEWRDASQIIQIIYYAISISIPLYFHYDDGDCPSDIDQHTNLIKFR